MREISRVSSDEDLAREEASINGWAWLLRLTALLLAGSVGVLLVDREGWGGWRLVVYPALIASPVAYMILGARFIQIAHLERMKKYQAQLLIQTAELTEMAIKDGLTKLYNRTYFYDCLEAMLHKARQRREPLALLLLDVDGLKAMNDEYGHMVGDAIIANLGRTIAGLTRGSDVPARLGGDEFGVIMPETDKRGAFALAERLWDELERTPMYEADGKRIMVTVSVGVAGYPWGGEDIDELMNWADADMYVNKASRHLPQLAAARPASAKKTLPPDLF